MKFTGTESIEKMLPGYQGLELVGSGKYGHVFKCVDLASQKHVCLKLLLDDRDSGEQEVNFLKQLQHPNIVQLIDTIESPQLFGLVSPYAAYGDLRSYMNRNGGCLLWTEIKLFFRQILSAVSYCHQQGIVHGDLKLSNMLVLSPARLVVADWGCATAWSPTAKQTFRHGTYEYAAPELWTHEPHYGPERDVWALGVILYVMMHARFPFSGASLYELRSHILSGSMHCPSAMSEEEQQLFRSIFTNKEERATVEQIEACALLNSSDIDDYQRCRLAIKKPPPCKRCSRSEFSDIDRPLCAAGKHRRFQRRNSSSAVEASPVSCFPFKSLCTRLKPAVEEGLDGSIRNVLLPIPEKELNCCP